MNDSPESSGSFKKRISKLTSKALAFLLGIALILLAGVIAWAVYNDRLVELGGVRIGSTKQFESQQIKELKADALTPADLPEIWSQGMKKAEMKRIIQEMAKRAKKLDELQKSPTFAFNQLEMVIATYRSINTKIRDESKREVYKVIQKSLQLIGFFDGQPNGDQELTYFALKKFQEEFNAEVPEERKIKPVGFLGRRTLAAIRARFLDLTIHQS